MNQELKQRLIGAIVVTALAAIFIPMLFDDPIDNSGQSISELIIPPTPVKTGEESANKLPTNANQILNAPDAGSETVVNTEEESELSSSNQLTPEAPLDDEPQVDTEDLGEPMTDEAGNDGTSTSLDTGIIDEPPKPVTTLKKTESNTTKAVTKVKPTTPATANTTEKSAVKAVKPKSEFSRWTIQAGSFGKKENAMSLMETLRKQGLPVTLDVSKGAGNTPIYRLKVGPVLDKKRALEMKAKMDSQKIQSLLIAE
ncbi:SPOR domain-containing protein [Methylobacter sp. S3L5C]|uniref:SPOR domain-containing protein n=1 Tax=Methylobacter sp. S3L5C TaxID=2839024 RepID=UPI001FAE53D3|nr:SPOR domain-containing protein [Methylobacter sp. S3L5C]UOA08809.1 SPOR domain-containing protein [Methylobacter sp. S3L5C]